MARNTGGLGRLGRLSVCHLLLAWKLEQMICRKEELELEMGMQNAASAVAILELESFFCICSYEKTHRIL
jgi:hypothetical protein